MFSHNPPLHAGQDPRAWTEYTQLRDEMSKLTHPARPDVDWRKVEQLCVTLFQHNGTDLQTAAWFCCARLQRAGLAGLSEGLDVVESLVEHQWTMLWPPQLPFRQEILVWLSDHLMLSLRCFTISHQDLPAVYRLEQQLRHLCDLLQRLELRQMSKLDALLHWMHAAVVRLESAKETHLPAPAESLPHHAARPILDYAGQPYSHNDPVVLVVRDDGTQRITQTSLLKRHRRGVWAGFAGGVVATLMVTSLSIWGLQSWHDNRPDSLINASLSPLPVILSTSEQEAMIEDNAAALQSQGRAITQRTQRLWPHQPDTAALAKQWQQQVEANAMPEARLLGWHQAMAQLQSLTDKLNSTDAQRGKYLTVSELKSSVFAIMQTLSQNMPVEEQLRQLTRQKKENISQTAAEQQVEQNLRQLLNRYALITHAD